MVQELCHQLNDSDTDEAFYVPGAHRAKQPQFTAPVLAGKQEEVCVRGKYSVPVGGNGFWTRGCNLKTRLVVTKLSLDIKYSTEYNQ